MGEIADMMLDGTLCEGCGEFMGGTAGYVRRCRACAKDAPRHAAPVARPEKAAKRVPCPCGKRFVNAADRDQHHAQMKRNGDPRHQAPLKLEGKLTP